ncbi:MAG: esterase-like activity of phytase family protein [Sulfitobacter sp.]
MRRFCAAIIAAVALNASAVSAELKLNLSSNTFWEVDAPWFGGFSALEMASDGRAATFITDRGMLVAAQIKREAGKITSIDITKQTLLRDAAGIPFADRVHDAEGLAIGAQGRAFVSFEFEHRVRALNRDTGMTQNLPNHPEFDGLPINKGLEALAIDAQGTLFALVELRQQGQDITPLYRFKDGQWTISHRIPLNAPFVPVGADIAEDGWLYLLERTVTPLGFRSRLRRFDLNADPMPSEILITTFPALFDNLEGLSVWTDSTGATRLTMVSDDNFLPIQRTQVVEYILTE